MLVEPNATAEAATRTALELRLDLIDQASANASGDVADALQDNFATQAALATEQSLLNAAALGTQTALVSGGLDVSEAQTQVAQNSLATQAALQERIAAAATAEAQIQALLATQVAADPGFATLVAGLTSVPPVTEVSQGFTLLDIFGPPMRAHAAPLAQEEPAALATVPAPVATLVAGATQQAFQDRAALIAEAILEAERRPADDDGAAAAALATALAEGFSTQVAFATLQAQVMGEIAATQTAVAETTEEAALTEVAASLNATQTALDERLDQLATAVAQIESLLQTQVALGGGFATQAALATPAAQETQSAISTAIAQAASGTLVVAAPTEDAIPSPTQEVFQDDEALATLSAVQTQVARIGDLSGEAAFATQAAFLTPPALSTA